MMCGAQPLRVRGRCGLVGPPCRWERRPRPGPPGAPPAMQASRLLRAFASTPRLDEVAGWGALPNSVVAGAAVPGWGARPFPTRASLTGATQLAVVANPTP